MLLCYFLQLSVSEILLPGSVTGQQHREPEPQEQKPRSHPSSGPVAERQKEKKRIIMLHHGGKTSSNLKDFFDSHFIRALVTKPHRAAEEVLKDYKVSFTAWI